ncbi:zinc/manganese transport system permease protein [Halopolyspora algeriensis]|uniref:Zinc/manganese transport system permease protein n=1 Tax=Halopolyspora algeriensis TaxID=1500506 RepID=A0A368VG33_9ACTN|nr:metal ABC transporter permease [Halopolyspora algeriensis]RCW40137.1 zinc/manganese transport system permease protein [Halopolyspora algeriensis]TQM46380.1 zinc/manganese transport system permease protein [Halopolyspora algeriensis]
MNRLIEALSNMLDFGVTADLLGYPFVQQALLAAAALGLVSGVLTPLVVTRKMSFAVHGTAELAFTGAAAALLLGVSAEAGALAGAVVAALLLGLLGQRDTERDSVIGAVLSFGLGIGALLLWMNPERTANKFSLLVGQIVGVDSADVTLLTVCAALVLVAMAFLYRPLLFASVDPDVAAARGVPARILAPVFSLLVGIATALGVHVVGALLVMALMVTPGAAASRVTASPVTATVLSVIFAEAAVLGGIVLSLAPGVPVSAFVTVISFAIYLVCRAIGSARLRRFDSRAPAPAAA